MRAIIFDFDGTIGDSFKVALEIFHEVTHRDQTVSPEEVARLRKLRLLDVARELQIPKWQWPSLLIRGRSQMTKRLSEIKPFPGVADVLAALQNDGYGIYIMSSNSESNIDKFLVDNNMRDYFTKIYGSIGLLGKARALRHVMSQNKLQIDDAIYIGDEPRDIIAAKQVGIPCVAVAWGYNSPELLVNHSPMVIVKTAKQLQKVLEEWASREA